ncbi:MAG: ABC transporter ATP-binding protein/permease [Treponemataceae bacterium]|nr:ABC transporter ATP-binding protein/permease [Treponemataceae bacterium]
MAQKNTYFQNEIIYTKIDIHQFRRIIRYILPFKKIFIFVFFLMLGAAIVSMIPPVLLRRIINETVYSKDTKELILIIAGMVLLAGIEIAVTYVQQTLMGKLGHGIIADIRKDVFYRLQELSFDYFDSKPNGKIVVRVTEYVNNLANFFTNTVVQLLIYIVKIVTVVFFMLAISPKLTLIVILSVVPMMVIVMLLRSVVKKMFSRLRAYNSNRTAFAVESIMGEKIIKNSNRGEVNRHILMDIHEICATQWRHIVEVNQLNTPVTEVFWNIGTLAMFAVALAAVLSGDLSMNAGTVVAFTSYMSIFSGPITQIAQIIQQLAQITSDLEHVFDTIDSPIDIKDKNGAETLNEVNGQVDLNDITFAYDKGVNILEHVNLHVKKGETIALVGPTGAGKTTIINMLTRFYDVQEGSVCIDGHNVKDLTLESLRKKVGVLMQDPFMFKGTILENIRYGRLDATDEECMAAARKIHADLCIDKLPGGYLHELDERGAGLSAGEKQMISFARIVLKNPSVVILDEATSSIDTETEMLIKQALDIITEGRTTFIVAHRLSTIRNADKILYIANKGIAEEGSHQELMAKKGLYYKLSTAAS